MFDADPAKITGKTQTDPNRMHKGKTSALKHYRDMDSIRRLKMTENYKMIVKVEKRLAKIRRKIIERNRDF